MNQAKRYNLKMLPLTLFLLALCGSGTAQESMKWSNVKIPKIPETRQLVRLGEKLYNQACFYCHGEAGKGDGLAERYLFTRPRDFTSGLFKLRSTVSGSIPTDEDMFRTITVGFPEFRMPRFAYLTAKERWALVYYIKRFCEDFKTEKPEFPDPVGPPPPRTDRLLADGKQLYADMECGKCHGELGQADGPSSADLKDDRGRPSRVAAFALGPKAYKRGSSPKDIVQTLITGLSGTPMPSYQGILSTEQAYALAYYVESLAE